MSNSNGKKLKSTLQSRRLVVPLVAILLLTNFQIGTRAVSAVDVGVSTKKIPAVQADQLINSANQIKQELGCQ